VRQGRQLGSGEWMQPSVETTPPRSIASRQAVEPGALQESSVQPFPSSQLRGSEVQPRAGSQPSIVQGSASSQLTVTALQTPPLHVSAVQALPSAQSESARHSGSRSVVVVVLVVVVLALEQDSPHAVSACATH
jgi:hypothetical protein